MTVDFEPFDRNPHPRADDRQPDYRRWKLFKPATPPPSNAGVEQDAETSTAEDVNHTYWEPRAPYGSVDAGYFWRGGRYFGCGISLVILLFPFVILFYGIYAISRQAIDYELTWLPLWTLQCITALAIFTFAPLLPFRLWMLFTAINKDNEDAYQEKPMPTRASLYQNEWDGWGKVETRKYLQSRPKDKGAGYLVMVGLFDESGAMPRLIKSLSNLKYTLSDDEEKDIYDPGQALEQLRNEGKDHEKIAKKPEEIKKLKEAYDNSPLDLMILVEESEEGVIEGKVEKVLGRKKEERSLELPNFVPGCFWFFSAALRLLVYPLIPVTVFKWFSNLLSRRSFGDPHEYSRNRDNGQAQRAPRQKAVPITTHQAAVREILTLPPEKRGRYVIARVPKGKFDPYLGKSEPQTKPRALNFGLYHRFSGEQKQSVHFAERPDAVGGLQYLRVFWERIAPSGTELPNTSDCKNSPMITVGESSIPLEQIIRDLRQSLQEDFPELDLAPTNEITKLLELFEVIKKAEPRLISRTHQQTDTQWVLKIKEQEYTFDTAQFRSLEQVVSMSIIGELAENPSSIEPVAQIDKDAEDLIQIALEQKSQTDPRIADLIKLNALLASAKAVNQSELTNSHRYEIYFLKKTLVYTQQQYRLLKDELPKYIDRAGLAIYRYIHSYYTLPEFAAIKNVVEASFGTEIFKYAINAHADYLIARHNNQSDNTLEQKRNDLQKAIRKFYESSFAQSIWENLYQEICDDRPVPVWETYHLDPSKIRYTVVYDAEDRPEEDQLLKAVREYEADRVLLEKLRVKSVIALMEMVFMPRQKTDDKTQYRPHHKKAFEIGVKHLKKRLMDADQTGGQPSLKPLRKIEEEFEALYRILELATPRIDVIKGDAEEEFLEKVKSIPKNLPFSENPETTPVIEMQLLCHLKDFFKEYGQHIQKSDPEYISSFQRFLVKLESLLNNPELGMDHFIYAYRLQNALIDLYDTKSQKTLRKHLMVLACQYRSLRRIVKQLDDEAVCFQAKLTYENLNDNWVISLFKADYASWFNYLLPGLHRNRMAIPLGGTSNHFKVNFLQHVGGWDAYNVAEDCDLGMWIARHGKQVRVLNSITWEVANSDIIKWVGQRSRWIKGYAQSYYVHMRRPLMLLNDLGWRRFWGFQFTVGAGFLMPMLSPFFYVMTGIYLVSLILLIISGVSSTEGTLEVAKIPLRFIYDIHYYWILPFGTGSFFISNVIYSLILVIGQLRHPKPGTMRWVVQWWWLYWIFMNVAAFRALYEYIFDPHSWDLSDHSYL